MVSGGTEWSEAGQVRIWGARWQARCPATPGMVRPKHCFTEVTIRRLLDLGGKFGEELAYRGLRRCQRLLGAVVDHRNAEGEQLDRHRGHHLVVEDQVGCEPEFDSAELVVVVENRYVLVSEVPVRTQAFIELIESLEIVQTVARDPCRPPPGRVVRHRYRGQR